MDMTAFLFGTILGGMGLAVFAIAIFALYILTRMEYKYYVRIRNMTGGKDVYEYKWAKKVNHPKLGTVYLIPSYKKENRPYIPFIDSKYEHPYKNKKFSISVIWYNGEYAFEDFDPIIKEKVDVINPETLVKESKEICRFVLRPVPKMMRQFVLEQDRVVNSETDDNLTWWDKNKWIVFGLIMGLIFAGVCLTMIVYSYQFSADLITQSAQVPAWMQNILSNQTVAMAPPPVG